MAGGQKPAIGTPDFGTLVEEAFTEMQAPGMAQYMGGTELA